MGIEIIFRADLVVYLHYMYLVKQFIYETHYNIFGFLENMILHDKKMIFLLPKDMNKLILAKYKMAIKRLYLRTKYIFEILKA